jgi:hypothetical protein
MLHWLACCSNSHQPRERCACWLRFGFTTQSKCRVPFLRSYRCKLRSGSGRAARQAPRRAGRRWCRRRRRRTPSGLYYLSNLDQNIAVIVQTVYCFRESLRRAAKAPCSYVEAEADIGDVTEPDPSVLGKLDRVQLASPAPRTYIPEMRLLTAQVRTAREFQ